MGVYMHGALPKMKKNKNKTKKIRKYIKKESSFTDKLFELTMVIHYHLNKT